MKSPLQITFHNIQNSEAVEEYVQDKLKKLDTLFADIISCHVTIELPHKHHHQGKQFNVRVNLSVPGDEIIVNRDHHEDIFIALREAFDAVKRQLEDYIHLIRSEVKTHTLEHIGHVSRISQKEGFGFILGEDATERYFHKDNVKSPNFEHLKKGDKVRFIDEPSSEGLQAKRVSVAH